MAECFIFGVLKIIPDFFPNLNHFEQSRKPSVEFQNFSTISEKTLKFYKFMFVKLLTRVTFGFTQTTVYIFSVRISFDTFFLQKPVT